MVATFRTSKMSEGSEKEEGSSGESGLRLDLSVQHGVARDPGTVQVSGNRAIEQQQWTKLLCDSEGGRRKQDHVIITCEHRLGIRA